MYHYSIINLLKEENGFGTTVSSLTSQGKTWEGFNICFEHPYIQTPLRLCCFFISFWNTSVLIKAIENK